MAPTASGQPVPKDDRKHLFERDDQLTILHRAFERAQGGSGMAVLVGAEAGVGKTSLVRAFSDQLGQNADVLVGACEDMLAPRPLGPFRDILRDAHLVAPSLSEAADRDVFIDLMLDLMRRTIRPTVLVVEDCHWADDASLDLIRFLGRRIEGLPACLVLTFRTEISERSQRLKRILGALPAASTLRIELSGLSDQVVTRITTAAGADPERIVPLVAGNPFYLNEVLASPESPLPATVRDAVSARVLAFPGGTRQTLELLSVAPHGVRLDVIDRLAENGTTSLAPAEKAGMIGLVDGRARFRHELARLSVEQGLGDARRIALNRRLVKELIVAGASPATLIHHAAEAHDSAAIAKYGPLATEQAAFAADHGGTATLAAVTLRREQDLDGAVAARLHAQAAYALYALNRFGEAARAAVSAVDRWREIDPKSQNHANTLLLAARMHTMTGSPAEARGVVSEALEILGPRGPSRDLALAHAMMGYIEAIEANCSKAVSFCTRAIDMARTVGAEDVVVHGLIYRGIARTGLGDLGGFDDNTRAIEIAREIDHGDFLCRAATNRAAGLIWLGRHPEAVPYLDLAEEAGREHGLDYLLFHVAAQKSHVDLFAGRWDHAATRLRAQLGTEADPAAMRILAMAILGRILLRRGEEGGHDLVVQAWNMALESRQVYRIAVAGGALVELAWLQGDDATLVSTAEILLPLAERSNLAYLRGEVLRYLMRTGVPATVFAGCPEGYAAAYVGDSVGAIEAWRRAGNPYEQALEMCLMPDVSVAFDGLRILEDLGATATAARFRKDMRDRGMSGIPRGPRRSTRETPSPLTERQLEVLGLVAEGLTSSQIASRLFLSRRTVDNHVSAISARIGASSRTQAVEMATDAGWLKSPDDDPS